MTIFYFSSYYHFQHTFLDPSKTVNICKCFVRNMSCVRAKNIFCYQHFRFHNYIPISQSTHAFNQYFDVSDRSRLFIVLLCPMHIIIFFIQYEKVLVKYFKLLICLFNRYRFCFVLMSFNPFYKLKVNTTTLNILSLNNPS